MFHTKLWIDGAPRFLLFAFHSHSSTDDDGIRASVAGNVRPAVGRSVGLVGVIFRSDQQPLHLPREVRAMPEPAASQGSSVQISLLYLV